MQGLPAGTTHTLSMFVKADDVELITGELRGYDKAADSGRTVRMLGCPECGTKVWNEPLSFPGILVMRPGTLDDASWARPVGNIRTDRALPWVEIDWSQPHFPGQPPDRQPLFDAYAAEIAKDCGQGGRCSCPLSGVKRTSALGVNSIVQ